MHIPFSAWAIVAAVVLGALALLLLYVPARRHLRRLGWCLGLGVLTAAAVTAWADRHRHAALAAAAARPAVHKVSADGSLAAAFAAITLVVAVVSFTVMTARHQRRSRAQSAAGGVRRRVRAW